MDRTGTAEWIATGIVTALGDSVTPLVLITVLALMATAFCLVISNVGACTLLVPLGASMASTPSTAAVFPLRSIVLTAIAYIRAAGWDPR